MDNQQFIDTIAAYAVISMKNSKILASLTIAQAILESGWGKSDLAVNGDNLFGIKGEGPAGEIKLLTDLNLRSGPGMQYTVIRVMKAGEAVNGFYNLGGNEWCSANPSYVAFKPYYRVKVTAEALNVRTGPDVKYSIVKQIKQNEIYQTFDYVDGWYKIGTDQWISGAYVVRV
ncbi:SH3 domain-containing protein [Ectobacillus panaciterrae]|uniref:SH3 domain-containing protein n=1 Tax=Ectobacillus panaciterrae TaxID=363872 RepID=UPI0004042C5D|nr:SH3 domain-containing protein [Ectobacillus panaciterrae]